jgi:hypothetical protein
VEKMRENRLRWYKHVIKREETNAVRVIMKMNVEGKRRLQKIGRKVKKKKNV